MTDKELIAKLVEALERAQWSEFDEQAEIRRCPICDEPESSEKHYPLCSIGNALALAEQHAKAPTEHYVADAAMLATLKLVLDFHSVATISFVEKYGYGMGTRAMCDRIRAVIAKAEERNDV